MDNLWHQDHVEGGEEGGEKMLSATAVCSALLTAIVDVCRVWGESLPNLTQVPGSINLSLHAIKNTRRKMEDRHAVCVDINSLFGLKVCVCVCVSVCYDIICTLLLLFTGLLPSVILCSI